MSYTCPYSTVGVWGNQPVQAWADFPGELPGASQVGKAIQALTDLDMDATDLPRIPLAAAQGPAAAPSVRVSLGEGQLEAGPCRGWRCQWERGWPHSLASWTWFQSAEMSETVRHNPRYTMALVSFKGKGERTTGLQCTHFKNLWCFQRNPKWQSTSVSTSFIQGE